MYINIHIMHHNVMWTFTQRVRWAITVTPASLSAAHALTTKRVTVFPVHVPGDARPGGGKTRVKRVSCNILPSILLVSYIFIFRY